MDAYQKLLDCGVDVVPVSYTHLDVYKRQTSNGVPLPTIRKILYWGAAPLWTGTVQVSVA